MFTKQHLLNRYDAAATSAWGLLMRNSSIFESGGEPTPEQNAEFATAWQRFCAVEDDFVRVVGRKPRVPQDFC